MLPIDKNVMGIFPHNANKIFALDAIAGPCESCNVEFARVLCSNVPGESGILWHAISGQRRRCLPLDPARDVPSKEIEAAYVCTYFKRGAENDKRK